MIKVKKFMNQWLKQMYQLYRYTFHFKGRTPLYECRYALAFQLILASIWVLTIYSIMVPELWGPGEAIAYVVWIMLGYFVLSLIPTASLLIRRFRDSGVSLFHVFVLPISYVLIPLMITGVISFDSLELTFLVPLLTFFFTHYYLVAFATLPSKKEE